MTLHALPILAIEEFAERGYVVVEHVLPDRQIEEAIVAVAEVEGRGLLQRNGSSYAIRDLLQSAPAIRGLCIAPKSKACFGRSLVRMHLPCAEFCLIKSWRQIGQCLGIKI